MPPLYTYLWLPKQPPRGLVHLVHGIGEHMGRYDSFATFLSEQGYAVFGCDAPAMAKQQGRLKNRAFLRRKMVGCKRLTVSRILLNQENS